MTTPCQIGDRTGFTLVEMITATAISSIIIVFLAQMLSMSQGIWINVDQGSNRMTSIRSALGIVTDDAHDLFGSGSRNSQRVPMYLSMAAGSESSRISFLTKKRRMDQDPSGDALDSPEDGICIVSYEVARSNGNGIRQGDLVRRFAGVSDTARVIERRNPSFFESPEDVDLSWAESGLLDDSVFSREVVASSVVLFEVIPMRFKRQGKTGPVNTSPRELENIFEARSVDTWPTPRQDAEVPSLPGGSIYDPDFSPPDFIRIRLVVSTSSRYSNLSRTEKSQLTADVISDLSDGRLDGQASGGEILSAADIQTLTLMTTSIAYPNHERDL